MWVCLVCSFKDDANDYRTFYKKYHAEIVTLKNWYKSFLFLIIKLPSLLIISNHNLFAFLPTFFHFPTPTSSDFYTRPHPPPHLICPNSTHPPQNLIRAAETPPPSARNWKPPHVERPDTTPEARVRSLTLYYSPHRTCESSCADARYVYNCAAAARIPEASLITRALTRELRKPARVREICD